MLIDAKLRQAKPRDRAYKLADSGGLFLLITLNGSRYWRWKYRYLGKEKLLALGVYPEARLSTACARRDVARAVLQSGCDPNAVISNEFKITVDKWLHCLEWRLVHFRCALNQFKA